MNRPFPNGADRAEAEAFVREVYDADPTVSREWIERHRPRLISYAADAIMLKRMNAAYGRMLDSAADFDSPAYREAADEFARLRRNAEARSRAA